MKFTKNLTLLLTIVFMGITSVCMAQQTPTASKHEMAIKKAEDKVAKIEKKMAIADSLITAGNVVKGDLKGEEDGQTGRLKEVQSEYASESKRLEKLMKSKDQTEVKQASLEKKALDAKYKADMKELDAVNKDAAKKAGKAEANIKKGKDLKKVAEKELKVARKELAAAQKAANAPEGKKKK
ncbi:MAG: hypothetical protein JXR39_04400 [Marinilabiliaceae bacterium]|nr:hypothetical protein [Marinilabiliaceae bacterium]